MIGRFESAAQPLPGSIAQKTASFMKTETARGFFACRPAKMKFGIIDRSFQIEQVDELVDIERHLRAIEIDQIWHGFKPGCSDESAEDIRRDLVVKDDFAIVESIAPRLVMIEPIGTAKTLAVGVAKSRHKCAEVFIDLVRFHHLIEVGIDPTILSPHKKDNDALRSFRKELAQSPGMIRAKILGREHDRF